MWVLLLSLVLAAVLLYFTLRGLDWSAFWLTIRTGRYEFLLLMLPIMGVNFFNRAVRWSVLVRSEKPVPVWTVFWANMVGYMGNAYLPARAGELLRSAFLGQKQGLGTSFVLATALTERTLDAVALVLIGSVSLLGQSQVSPAIVSAARFTGIAGLIAVAVIVLAPFQQQTILNLVQRLPLPTRMSEGLSGQIARFLLGMRSLHGAGRLLAFLGLTAVIWLLDAIGVTIGVHIVGQTLGLGQAFILLAALGLSSAVPSTPGYVGVYQFVAVTVLVPFGFSRAGALAYILIAQVLNYIIVGLLGMLGLWQINKRGKLEGS